MASKSTILELQRSILSATDPSLIIKISSDNTTITVSNITPDTFAKLPLVSNDPSFGTYYFFITLHVYIGGDLLPTKILGLDKIIESKIRSSDLDSFIGKKSFHTPFSKGFKNGLTITDLINKLSLLSLLTPDVPLDAPLKFTLVMDPKKVFKHWKKGLEIAGGIVGGGAGAGGAGRALYKLAPRKLLTKAQSNAQFERWKNTVVKKSEKTFTNAYRGSAESVGEAEDVLFEEGLGPEGEEALVDASVDFGLTGG